MRRFLASSGAVVAQALPGVGGVALVSYGAWLAYRPAGFVVAGVLILADVVASRQVKAGGDE